MTSERGVCPFFKKFCIGGRCAAASNPSSDQVYCMIIRNFVFLKGELKK